MLFLYNPIESMVRKHGTAFDSFFDDDFTPSDLIVKRARSVGDDDDDDDNSNEGAFKLTLDIPGIKESDIQVTVDHNVLTINGETKNRRFRKIMTVEQGADLSQLTAQLSDGVLTITAPPKAKPALVQIPITSDDVIEEESSEKNNNEATMMRRSIEIPGVKHSDLKVTFEEGTTLHVHGMRRGQKFDKKFHIDTDKINTSELTANLSHGILTVQAPKLPTAEPQTVTIESSTADRTSNNESPTVASVLVSMDLPGVRIQDVTVNTVQVDKRHTALDIRASRNNHGNNSNNNHKKVRISKQILVDHDMYNVAELKAQLLDGVLTITASKKPEAGPRTVPIVGTGRPMKRAIAHSTETPAVDAEHETQKEKTDAVAGTA